MSEALELIVKASLALSEEEQFMLIDILADHLTQKGRFQLNEMDKIELDRRMREVEEGKVQPIPWREVMDKLKKKYEL